MGWLRNTTLFSIGFSILAAGTAQAGPAWSEGGDAGSTPIGAQTVSGVGAVHSISGSLSGGNRGLDFEDMYRIFIADPANFEARTDGGGARPNFATFNTQLWLFADDPVTGVGLLGNDDTPDLTAPLLNGSLLQPTSDDGTGVNISMSPGIYYLAISGFDNDPCAGVARFPVIGCAGGSELIFSQSSAQEISGPDGLGGPFPITGWTGEGEIGSYEISLEGVEFIPEPSAGALCAAGLLLFRRRRRASLR